MRNNSVPPCDTNNPHARLKALRHNPRLQVQRPTPVATPSFNHLDPTHKPVPTIRHANLHMRGVNFWQRNRSSEIPQYNGTETALTVLPPYSPVLNQIEMVFSKRKTLFRKADERTIDVNRRRILTPSRHPILTPLGIRAQGLSRRN